MESNTISDWFTQNNYDLNDINKVGLYGNSALMKAVREGNEELTYYILKLQPNLELKNIDGNTALWNGCFGQSFECVKALVKAGIKPNTTNDNGVTALMYCASSGREDMVKLLLEFGADKSIENLDGFKAIDLATTAKIYKMLKNS